MNDKKVHEKKKPNEADERPAKKIEKPKTDGFKPVGDPKQKMNKPTEPTKGKIDHKSKRKP